MTCYPSIIPSIQIKNNSKLFEKEKKTLENEERKLQEEETGNEEESTKGVMYYRKILPIWKFQSGAHCSVGCPEKNISSWQKADLPQVSIC